MRQKGGLKRCAHYENEKEKVLSTWELKKVKKKRLNREGEGGLKRRRLRFLSKKKKRKNIFERKKRKK